MVKLHDQSDSRSLQFICHMPLSKCPMGLPTSQAGGDFILIVFPSSQMTRVSQFDTKLLSTIKDALRNL